MKIAILGSRGVPNVYGGFEQFAEYLAVGLVEKGHEVTVYNSSRHPYMSSFYKGVRLIKKHDAVKYIGPAANFLYDYLCLRDALASDPDIILELGYQSSAPSYYVCNIDKTIVITNMDGMEWMRAKWSRPVKALTRLCERIAVRKSRFLVSDSPGIQDYLNSQYGCNSRYIPYGAIPFDNPDTAVLSEFALNPFAFYLMIARLEPENNIETVLSGYSQVRQDLPFVIVGNIDTRYGQFLRQRFKQDDRVRFVGGIYNLEHLNNLRHFSKLYLHGHSVGGTNPSLLEAMAAGALIAAHKNAFNAHVLSDYGWYFDNENDVARLLEKSELLQARRVECVDGNLDQIKRLYSWDKIIDRYEQLFFEALNEHHYSYAR